MSLFSDVISFGLDGQRWRLDAACLDSDPTLFHSDGPGSHATIAAAKAKAICAGCPVRVQCLADANAVRDEHGVRGGLTARERKDGRPAYIAKCGTRSGYGRHRRLGEVPCADCRKANSNSERKRRVAA